jgi:hypothetical protein
LADLKVTLQSKQGQRGNDSTAESGTLADGTVAKPLLRSIWTWSQSIAEGAFKYQTGGPSCRIKELGAEEERAAMIHYKDQTCKNIQVLKQKRVQNTCTEKYSQKIDMDAI